MNLQDLLQDWTTNRQSARTWDDILNKLPYTDEKREFTYFRMEDFFNQIVNEIIGRKTKIKPVI